MSINKINQLNRSDLEGLCKCFIRSNNEDEEKMKKYKQVNENIKLYIEVAQQKIKEKNRKKILEEMKEIEMKEMEVNVKEEDENENDCHEDIDQDDTDERFICDFEGCKQVYKKKEQFVYHFKSHFTGSLTCKECGQMFGLNQNKQRMLSHKNKNKNKKINIKIITIKSIDFYKPS